MNVYENLRNLDFTRTECVAIMNTEDDDFIVVTGEQEYRFIHIEAIDDILVGELCDRPHMIGYFNAWFLAKVLDVPVEDIKNLQKSHKHEIIGDWVMDKDKVEALVKDFFLVNGYGEYFAQYDGHEEEVHNHLVFRIY